MSFEIGHESRAAYGRGTRRVQAGYPGLGATAFATLTQRVVAPTIAAAATAPWQVGLPGPGDSKDNTRIAYAKRDHDLAMPPRNDATAYANLKSQAVGSATKVGKAWYNAALNDVNNARAASTPKPPPTIVVNTNPAIPPTSGVKPIPYIPAVLIDPIVKQATDMGLKVQQTTDGSVVAVDSSGAVVSKPLPVSTSQVTDSAIVPTNAVQANAPPPRAKSSGIFSILDKLTQSAPASTSGDNFVSSGGAPAPTTAPTAPAINTGDVTGGMFDTLTQNPLLLVGVAVGAYFLFASSSGRRR